jgi:hypothetical protein
MLSILTVTNTQDNGSGSLRDAIGRAGMSDTITFAPSLFSGGPATITLSTSAINVPNDVTIQGPGADFLTISGNKSLGIFNVTAPAGSGQGATLLDLTVADGKSNYSAIENRGTLTMTGCAISGNVSPRGAGGGGFLNYGTLNLTACTVSGNSSAASAGGILSRGSSAKLNMINCTVAYNTAGTAGGGIFNYYGTATLVNCTVAGNSASTGGGTLNTAGTMTIDNTIVSGNSGGDASGQYSGSHDLIGVNAKIDSLEYHGGRTQTMPPLLGSPAIDAGDLSLVPAGIGADQRGAVRTRNGTVDIGAVESGPTSLVVTALSDSTFGSGMSLREALAFGNFDEYPGDVITFDRSLFNGVAQTITLSHGELDVVGDEIIQGPSSSLLTVKCNGGSVVFGAASTGGRCTISGLTITNGSSNNLISDLYNLGTLTLNYCTVSSNTTGSFGGGIDNEGTLTMTSCTVSNNYANSGGAGIANHNILTMTGCTVSGNTTRTGDGGGIYNFPYGILVLNDTTITANKAGVGGGIFNEGTLTLNGGSISNNKIALDGGGIYNKGTLTSTGCTISGNTAVASGAAGGGIFNKSKATISGGSVSNNSAGYLDSSTYTRGYGGGVYNQGNAKMTLTGCTVSGNTATTNGGGISNQAGASLTMTRCTVSGNSLSAKARSGGGIFNQSSRTALIGCTVTGNTSPLNGGGIQTGTTLVLTDCTVSDNMSGSGGGIQSLAFAPNFLEMTNCTISGNKAAHRGGGIFANSMRLTNCTVYDNEAYSKTTGGGQGGGIYTGVPAGDSDTFTNCTITNNYTVGGSGANICNNFAGGTLTLNNCIIAYSDANDNIFGLVSGNNNLLDSNQAAGGLKVSNGNIVAVPDLMPLGNYGGPTKTRAPKPLNPATGVFSPAINAGDPSLVPAGVMTDQRGAPRIKGGKVDIGAVESGPATITVITLADRDDGAIEPALAPATSLRDAINFVNGDFFGGDTITFAAGLNGTLALADGPLPALTANMNVVGPGANVLSVSGQGASRIMSVSAGAAVTVSGLTLADGSASTGGGIDNLGTLVLSDCTVSGNSASTGKGGGIYNDGTLLMIGSTVSGNSAQQGGGIFNVGGLVLTNCTIYGNTAHGSSPVSGNGPYAGGGIYNFSSGSLTLNDCTVAGNSAQEGGGLYNVGSAAATLNNTIVAAFGGSVGGDITGTVSGNYNLIDDATSSGGLTNNVSGNLVGVSASLGSLGNNGGPTRTMALLAGSPAIDAGNNSLLPAGLTTDQRGAERQKSAAVDIGAFERGPQIIVVTTLSDSSSSGTSLRDAIDFVNSIDPFGADTISFAAGLTGTIDLTHGILPAIAAHVGIIGPGAGSLTIDAQNSSGILSIEAGSDVLLSGLSLVDGSAAFGGAIQNDGSLSMTACTVSGNVAGFGGSVFNSGTLFMGNCTVSGNYGDDSGGGISNIGALALTNCTVADNLCYTGSGGGIYNYAGGRLTMNDSTVSGNGALSGGGLNNSGSATATLNNTIVANSSAGGDIAGTVSGSYNLIDDATSSGGLTNRVNGNLVDVDPLLGPLRNNGGPMQTMALLAGSPAIGAGSIALLPQLLTTDQRGVARTDGSAVDIGAVESGPTTIMVTTLLDQDNGTINPFAANGTTLREAIEFANASAVGGDTITFSPLLKGAIDLTDGPLPAITANMTIDGPGADELTIDGQGANRVLSVQAGASVTISGLTLADGHITTIGGGIDNNGMLTLTDCAVSGSWAQQGGGVYNNGTLSLNDCTVASNSSGGSGAGIVNIGTMTLTDSTVANNVAGGGGGGAWNNGTLTLTDCTFAGNSALEGGGLLTTGSHTVTLKNTIVADSPSGLDLINGGGPLAGSGDLVGDGSGGPVGTITGDPKLGPLAWNGGPTQTMALFTGSPAIGKAGAVSIATDQRGFALDSPPDIGAFQYQGPPPTVTISGPAKATAQVETTFTLTATDPTTSDQNGTFTYIIDWNGNGSDIQTVKGPASFRVMHGYNMAGSFAPSVTVVDQDNRSGSPPAQAAQVVVSGLTTTSLSDSIAISSVTISSSNGIDASTAFQIIDSMPQVAWNEQNSANVALSPTSLLDSVIDPTSSNAQINVSGSASLGTVFDVGSETNLAQIAVIIAAGLTLAAIGGAGATGLVTDLGYTVLDTSSSFGSESGSVISGVTGVVNSGMVQAGLSAVEASGTAAVASTGYYAVGASPALVVDQGRVTWSNSIMGTMTDASTIIVKGGTLTPDDNWITGTEGGTQPVIEVDGGTLILGNPQGTGGNHLAAFGIAPFVQVTGPGMVIVEGGNTFDQITSDFTAQAAGSTVTQLASSSPTAVPGQAVTYTATVTVAGAPENDGAVEFFDSTTKTYLGTSALSNATATLTVTPSALTVGDTIVATYLPPTNAFAPSSGEVIQSVVLATSVGLTGPTSTPTYGQSLTFAATVTNTSGSGGTPTGSIEFFDGTTDLGPGTTLSGTGATATSTFTTASLTGGSHSINVVYTPSGTFEGGGATLTTFTIARQATTTTLVASAPGTIPGQPVTFTATVAGTANEPGLPGGSVQFELNGQPYGRPGMLSANDTASVAITASATGSYTVSANYSGDTNYQPSPTMTTLTEPVLGPGAYPLSNELFVVGGASTSDSIVIGPTGSKTDGTTGLSVNGTINKAAISKNLMQTFAAIVIYGGNRNNTVTLAASLTLPTTILEGSGNDNISGGNGNTTVTAGSGNDRIQLGSGDDTIILGDGNDNVTLGDGNDNVTVGNGNDTIQLGNGSDVVVEGNGNDSVTAGNGADLVVGGLGQHTIRLGNGNDILIDGSATVASANDSLRQILSDWNSSSSASVNTRLKVVYNTTHPNVLQAGSNRNWFFYKNPPTTSNKKSTDFWTWN